MSAEETTPTRAPQEGNGNVQKIARPNVNHSAGRGIPVLSSTQPKTLNRVPLRAQPKTTREVVDMKMFPVPLGEMTASAVTKTASQPNPRIVAMFRKGALNLSATPAQPPPRLFVGMLPMNAI